LTPADPPDTGPPSLSASLRALGTTLFALVCARAELIAVELQEERERAGQKLVLAVLAAVFLAMGMLLVAFLVVVLFWDSYRLLAAGGVTLLYLGIGAWALLRMREMNRTSPPPFAATMSEFKNDLQLLRGSNE
jgi:uncharacterized membrane protein YqjE